MIVYRATKDRFLADTFERDIHEIIQANLRERGLNVGAGEVRSWKESLVYMAKALNDDDIPADSGIAIEYGIPQSAKRIDFILCGQDDEKRTSVVIVELKAWTSAKSTQKDAIVVARFAQGEREVSHPSYQAWSYAALLKGFNEAVYDGDLALRPCAYLHNYAPDDVISNDFYRHHIDKAPLFFTGEAERKKLRSFIKAYVKFGDHADAIYKIENGRIRPSKMLVDSVLNMMKGKEEFVLIDDQKVVFETAMAVARQSSDTAKRVLIVEGGPGTGKSVVAINLLVNLSKAGLVCRYVSKNAAPRAVYEAKLTGAFRRTEISNLFSGSGVFVGTEPNAFDVLIVDEAHRLNERSGLYGNLGENQIKEIVSAAKCSIYFIDEDQRVTLKDVGRSQEIEKWAEQFDATVTRGQLVSQFRCNGSDGYLAWLDSVLQIRSTANEIFDVSEFDYRVVDSPRDLRALIREQNAVSNKARLVAGYCWNWASKRDPSAYDIDLPDLDFRARWNLTQDGSLWIISPDSVEEIGCIHTCQGLEVDYIGVIVGPDFVVRDGQVITRPEFRAKTDKSLSGLKRLLKADPEDAKVRADLLIKNTYRALMTRGIKGCLIYCTDLETATYFKSRLAKKNAAEMMPVTSGSRRNDETDNRVLPFERVERRKAEPYVNSVPVIDLKFAAGVFSDTQLIAADHDEWAILPIEYRAQPDLFVAQVVGESMNRRVPNGSWCLFRFHPTGTRQGKAVVAQHHSIADPESGGTYTFKVYFSKKAFNQDGSWLHTEVTLRPDSNDRRFRALTFGPDSAGALRIVAELISVL